MQYRYLQNHQPVANNNVQQKSKKKVSLINDKRILETQQFLDSQKRALDYRGKSMKKRKAKSKQVPNVLQRCCLPTVPDATQNENQCIHQAGRV